MGFCELNRLICYGDVDLKVNLYTRSEMIKLKKFIYSNETMKYGLKKFQRGWDPTTLGVP